MTRDTGAIAEYRLEADGWLMIREEKFEQAVLAMSLRDDRRVLVVCDTMVYTCDPEFTRNAVYGYVGLEVPGKASWYGAEAVHVCGVHESIFIGTPRGIVVLAALGGQAKGLYREVLMVPPWMVDQVVATGGVAAECVVAFE